MPTRQFIVNGTSDSPQAGTSTFTSPFLGQCFVNYIIIDNQIINQLSPSAQFNHLYLQNMVDISPLTWVMGSHVIFDTTLVQQKPEV